MANYRSSILDLFQDREEILLSYACKTFFEVVLEQSIHINQTRLLDIAPILEHFRQLGSSQLANCSYLPLSYAGT